MADRPKHPDASGTAGASGGADFRIFLNYRREDASGHAGRLFDFLRHGGGEGAGFGKDQIFMDIDTVAPGVDFRRVIEQAVGSCDVFIAVIGRHWLNAVDAKGRRRLDNANDFVRLEIQAALERDIPVVPALVQGAQMPSVEEVPESLQDFVHRNAVELSDARWSFDAGRLAAWLKTAEEEKARRGQAERERQEQEEAEQAERERLEKEAAERAEQERLEREAAERRLREEAEREEAAERAERERLEKEAAQQTERERLEKEAAERAERGRLVREAVEQAERERLEKKAAERADRERLVREAVEEAERERLVQEAAEREAAERRLREKAERLDRERNARKEADRLDRETTKQQAEAARRERRGREAAEREERPRNERWKPAFDRIRRLRRRYWVAIAALFVSVTALIVSAVVLTGRAPDRGGDDLGETSSLSPSEAQRQLLSHIPANIRTTCFPAESPEVELLAQVICDFPNIPDIFSYQLPEDFVAQSASEFAGCDPPSEPWAHGRVCFESGPILKWNDTRFGVIGEALFPNATLKELREEWRCCLQLQDP